MSDNSWISVNERLPEEDGLYLVCIELPVSGYARTIVQFAHNEWLMNFNVAYWMPLPEVPEEDKK